MSEDTLFPLPAAVTGTRVSNRSEVERLKKLHGIWTHHAKGAGDWMAMSVPACLMKLSGYPLTEREKSDPFCLLAGYSRILDEAGLIADGHPTELSAVQAAVSKLSTP